MSEVKKTKVEVATFGSSRTAAITTPTALSMSWVASPIGPRMDCPHDVELHEFGVCTVAATYYRDHMDCLFWCTKEVLNMLHGAVSVALTVVERHVQEKWLRTGSGILNEVCTGMRITVRKRVQSCWLLDDGKILYKSNQAA